MIKICKQEPIKQWRVIFFAGEGGKEGRGKREERVGGRGREVIPFINLAD